MLNKDTLESILNRIHDWIKAADQKVSIFFAFQSIVVTLMVSNISALFSGVIYKIPLLLIILLAFSIFLMFYGCFKSLQALIPRLKYSDTNKSLIYFGDIAKLDFNDYNKAINNMNDKDYSEELIKQIYVSSRIATKKHEHFRDSLIISILGIIIFIVPIISLLFYGK